MVGTRRPPQRGIGDACACASVDAITSRVRLALPPPSESLRHCACTLAHGPSLSRLAHVGMAPHAHVENSCIRSGCSRSCSGPLLLRASVRPVGPWDHWNQCALFPPAFFAPFPHAHPREPFASALSAMQAAGTCTGTRCRKFWQPCAAGTNTSLRGES